MTWDFWGPAIAAVWIMIALMLVGIELAGWKIRRDIRRRREERGLDVT